MVGSPRRFLTLPDHDVIRESRINDCSGIRSDSRFNRLPFVASHRGRLRLPNATYVYKYVRSCRLLYYYILLTSHSTGTYCGHYTVRPTTRPSISKFLCRPRGLTEDFPFTYHVLHLMFFDTKKRAYDRDSTFFGLLELLLPGGTSCFETERQKASNKTAQSVPIDPILEGTKVCRAKLFTVS